MLPTATILEQSKSETENPFQTGSNWRKSVNYLTPPSWNITEPKLKSFSRKVGVSIYKTQSDANLRRSVSVVMIIVII